ncbi:MAG: MFS transporter [Syntrophorhabdaceae bacterium]|nr:MFS transporter [Syntrophorhabdaceae bacterium]
MLPFPYHVERWLPVKKGDFKDPGQKNAFFISLSQSITAFSINFVTIFLPFYIFKISPYPEKKTLLWIGAIMSINGILTAIASPLWGLFAHRVSPKMLYQRGQIAHAIFFFLMAFTTDIHMLFLLRFFQGMLGGVSTIGLILVSSSSSKEKVSSNIGLFQSFLTLGQLSGPPLGTIAAASLGYRNAFFCGSALLIISFILTQIIVSDVPKLPKGKKREKNRSLDRGIVFAFILCFIVQIQLVFLPSILPKVLETLNILGERALKTAGVVVMLYTVSTVIGTFIITRLTKRDRIIKVITFLIISGIFLQCTLSFTGGIVSFVVVRMLQTGIVSASIPLVISMFVRRQEGGVIGLLNASRFAGNAAGPMLASAIMAISGFKELCFIIGGLGCFALFFFRQSFKEGVLIDDV